MANYSLILDTKFKPFSYQEMLAPVAAATQAHQIVEEEYGNLSAKASVWENMANEQTDPYAYKMYKTYADDLSARADQLLKQGLNASSRKQMLDMRTRYSKEITPIETAYKRRQELADKQRDAIAANPTLRYQRYMRNTSLDDLIRNPSLDWGESYSGALLTQQVSQAAANFQRALTDKGKLQALGLPFQYERKIQEGATPAQVMAAMSKDAQQGDPEAVRFLRGIVDQVLESSGVADWADPTTMAEFRAFANQGLYSAIGKAKIDAFNDEFGMRDALDARSQARQAARERAKAAANGEGVSHAKLIPVPLRSQHELDKLEKDFMKYKKYFYTNKKGQIQMNYAGMKEYARKVSPTAGGGLKYNVASDKTDFRKFMDSLGADKFFDKKAKGTKGIQPGNMGLIWRDKVLRKRGSGSYDTYHTTEYKRALESAYGEEFTSQLLENNRLEVVNFNGKNGFKTEKYVSPEDLEGYTATSVRYSRYGDTAILTGKGKEPIRIKIPAGLSISDQANVQTSISLANQYGEVLDKGKKPKVTANGGLQTDSNGNVVFTNTPLNEYDKAFYSTRREEALDNMSMYGSQYVVPSKTKTEEWGVLP